MGKGDWNPEFKYELESLRKLISETEYTAAEVIAIMQNFHLSRIVIHLKALAEQDLYSD